MENEIVVYEAQGAVAKTSGQNYKLALPTGASASLVRNVDFGVIPKTKSPSLYKAGAEKICMAYGLMQRFSVESKLEEIGDDPVFFYMVRCDLVKIANNGQEYVFASAYGSANTKERRNGFNGAFDAANSTLKMAQKRALVAAALAVSGLSSMFTQDIEDEAFMSGYTDIQETLDPNAKITAKQVKRLFALASDAGYSGTKAKNMLASHGFASTKDITQAQYDEACAIFTKGSEN